MLIILAHRFQVGTSYGMALHMAWHGMLFRSIESNQIKRSLVLTFWCMSVWIYAAFNVSRILYKKKLNAP